MTNYAKGTQFEYRVREAFRKHGYTAERKAASAPYDIIVMKEGRIVCLIDAKKTSQKEKKHIHISREDVEKIIRESSKLGTLPLIVWGFQRSPIYFEKADEILKNIKGKTFRLEEGNVLDVSNIGLLESGN